jgi:hypothetical protein
MRGLEFGKEHHQKKAMKEQKYHTSHLAYLYIQYGALS